MLILLWAPWATFGGRVVADVIIVYRRRGHGRHRGWVACRESAHWGGVSALSAPLDPDGETAKNVGAARGSGAGGCSGSAVSTTFPNLSPRPLFRPPALLGGAAGRQRLERISSGLYLG